MADLLSADQATMLLDGIDAAFEDVLHGRYGGGILATMTQDGAGPNLMVLRTARAGTEDAIRLSLQRRGATTGHAVEGIPIGATRLTAPPGANVESTTVQTEIFLNHDPNEYGDATAHASGVLILQAPASLPNGGLLVVRSIEAGANHVRLALAERQNWRPNPNRSIAGSNLGASGRGHRRSDPASLMLPVSRDILTRIGGAVASVGAEIFEVAVVLLPGDKFSG